MTRRTSAAYEEAMEILRVTEIALQREARSEYEVGPWMRDTPAVELFTHRAPEIAPEAEQGRGEQVRGELGHCRPVQRDSKWTEQARSNYEAGPWM